MNKTIAVILLALASFSVQASVSIDFADQKCRYNNERYIWQCPEVNKVTTEIQVENTEATIHKKELLARNGSTKLCIEDITLNLSPKSFDRDILWKDMTLSVNGYGEEVTTSFISNGLMRNTILAKNQRYVTTLNTPKDRCMLKIDQHKDTKNFRGVGKIQIKVPFLNKETNERGFITANIKTTTVEASTKEALLAYGKLEVPVKDEIIHVEDNYKNYMQWAAFGTCITGVTLGTLLTIIGAGAEEEGEIPTLMIVGIVTTNLGFYGCLGFSLASLFPMQSDEYKQAVKANKINQDVYIMKKEYYEDNIPEGESIDESYIKKSKLYDYRLRKQAAYDKQTEKMTY